MATPTLQSTGLTTISDAESTTGWTGTSVALDTDLFRENANSIGCILRTDLGTIYYDNGGGASAIDMTGEHVRAWINFAAVAFLDTELNNGMEFFMYDGTNTAYWVVFGSDTYQGGWKNVVVDCDSTPDSGSFNKTTVQRWGFRFNRTAAPAQKDNTWVDYFRYGDGYYVTGGTSGDKIDLAGIYVQDSSTTNGYGIIDRVEGVFFSYGALTIGNGATTTYFEMIGDVLVYTDSPVSSTLYTFTGAGSGCNITIESSVLRAAGSTNTFSIDMSDANLNSMSLTDSFIARAGAITFKSGQTVSGNTFENCGQITPDGADFRNSTVSAYEGTANTSAIIYNNTADPDGEFDGLSITKGTAATHAIEFGTSSPTSMTLRDCDFSGYSATDNVNDSTFHFKRTSGSVTLNLVNCTGNASYRTDGASISIVQDPVTTTAKCLTTAGAAISGVRVRVEASDGTGDLLYQAAVTSITQTAGTATVTTTAAHGLATNNYVVIRGAQPDGYNKVAQVTVTGASTFTYSVDSSLSTPATGTPLVTEALIYGTTDVNGEVSDTRTLSAVQPITGVARKATSAPYYKTGIITGTASNSTNTTFSVVMISDE